MQTEGAVTKKRTNLKLRDRKGNSKHRHIYKNRTSTEFNKTVCMNIIHL